LKEGSGERKTCKKTFIGGGVVCAFPVLEAGKKKMDRRTRGGDRQKKTIKKEKKGYKKWLDERTKILKKKGKKSQ